MAHLSGEGVWGSPLVGGDWSCCTTLGKSLMGCMTDRPWGGRERALPGPAVGLGLDAQVAPTMPQTHHEIP